MKINENDITFAFKKNHEGYLAKIHLYLNKCYYKLIFNQDEEFALNELEICKLKQIENVWIEHEKIECFNKYDCYKQIKKDTDVEAVICGHPAYQHRIFKYMSEKSSLDDIKYFISNDSVLNLEFFDYLAFSVIGTSEQAKLEIMCNMWDEAGRGCVQLFHTHNFKKLMKSLELNYNRNDVINRLSWEGVAGINLFSYMSLYTSNKMKFFGVLAATEMLDPPHYYELLKAFSHVGNNNKIATEYYEEHVTLDVVHANGWLNNVIIPYLRERPDKLSEFWLGFYLRLDSVQRYYDKILKLLQNKKAA